MQDELFVTLDEGDFIEAHRAPQRSRRLRTLVLLLALALALLIVALHSSIPA